MGRGRQVLLLAAVAAGCVLAAGCGEKKVQETAASQQAATESESAAAVPAAPVVWEGEYQCQKGDPECRDDKFPGEAVYFRGTVFNTGVNADVNVRAFPSTAGANMFQVKKETKAQILGVSRSGWVFVTTREVIPRRGWIAGQFVEFTEGQKVAPAAELKIEDFTLLKTDSTSASLILSYKIGGDEKKITLNAYKEKGQNFFTFFFDIYNENSHYGIVPGLYVWHFARNQLKHAASLVRGPFVQDEKMALWDWAAFTDDQKFYFAREGDKLLAFRASDNRRLLAEATGLAIGSLRDKTVRCPCPSDAVVAKDYKDQEEMDERISEYADAYAEENPRPDNKHSLEVICEVFLETGVRRIAGAEWQLISQ